MSNREKKNFPQMIGGYNVNEETRINAEDCLNLYLAVDPRGQKDTYLLGGPGKTLVDTIGVGPHRGVLVHDGVTYLVSREEVYSVNSNFVEVNLFDLATSSGFVSIAASDPESGGEVVFADGTNVWVWDISGATVTQVIDPNLPSNPVAVVYFDGYFWVISGDSPRFAISALNDGTSYPNFADISTGNVSRLRGIAELNNRVFIFTDVNTVGFYNANADPADPGAVGSFRRDQSIIIEYGAVGPGSVARGVGRVAWLSQSDRGQQRIFEIQGQREREISTDAVDDLISTLTNLNDAIAYIYEESGQIFYVINFTADNLTLAYDFKTSSQLHTNVWHTRAQLDGTRDEGQTYFFFNNKHYVGSFVNGNIYESSTNIFTDNGTPRRYIRTSAPLFDEGHRYIEVRELELLVLSGEAPLNVAEGNELSLYGPILLRISNDRNQTFSDTITRYSGARARTRTRVFWDGLGTDRDWTFRVESISSNKFGIIGASINAVVHP